MTNPKIEKVKAGIAKTQATIAEHQAKLKKLEAQKIELENAEIVAMYRRENLTEDDFAALLRSQRTCYNIQTTNITPHINNLTESPSIDNTDREGEHECL